MARYVSQLSTTISVLICCCTSKFHSRIFATGVWYSWYETP